MKKLKALVLNYWRVISKPSVHYSLGVLAFGGFLVGIIFWGGFNTAKELTNTETFRTSCREFDYMDFTRQSKRAVDRHSTALAGGEKTCIDCHKGIAHRLPDMTGVDMAGMQ